MIIDHNLNHEITILNIFSILINMFICVINEFNLIIVMTFKNLFNSRNRSENLDFNSIIYIM